MLSRTLATSDVAGVLNEVGHSGVAGEICFQPLHPDTSYEKIEKTVQLVIGLGLLASLKRPASLERTRHFRCVIATSH